MAELQERTVSLMDLKYFPHRRNEELRIETDKLNAEFAELGSKIGEVFDILSEKRVLDAICNTTGCVEYKGNRLYFLNQEVKNKPFGVENCIEEVRGILSAFPKSINETVAAVRLRNTSGLKTAAFKLCEQFNTLAYYRENADILKRERVARLSETKSEETVMTTDDFSKIIRLPIGIGIDEKGEEREITLDLRSDNPAAHAVIAGMIGTGKTSFLQSLILGGAYRYSPEQLQLWIFDFKSGMGFKQAEALKHVKVMSYESRRIDALEVSDYIFEEYYRRSEELKKVRVGNIIAYNEMAKSRNKPLMPRLVIVIDEFAEMDKLSFGAMSVVARLGRSFGMSFILSSQVIYANADYSEIIRQANHIFEFNNSDECFGKLVKTVTAAEASFIRKKPQGRGIYRHDLDRFLFISAYAGNENAQEKLIREINEKWKDFPATRPIITGNPERLKAKAETIVCNAEEIRNRYYKNDEKKEVWLPFGKTRTGKTYFYKVNTDKPLLLLLGNERRVVSAEYTAAENFRCLSDGEENVYYLDLNRSPDRVSNVITDMYSVGKAGVYYAETNADAKQAIDKVYDILKKRLDAFGRDRTVNIGNPIEVIIHNAENLSELKNDAPKRKLSGLSMESFEKTKTSVDFSKGEPNLAERLSRPHEQSEENVRDEIKTIDKIKYIIDKGKNARIYLMMYFGSINSLNDFFVYNYSFPDILIMPEIPEEYGERSYSEIIAALKNCRQNDAAGFFEKTQGDSGKRMNTNDFVCAELIDNNVLHMIIPFEWE